MKVFTSFLFLVFFSPTSSHAFTMNNSAKLVFSQEEVKVNVAAGCVNTGINDEEMLSIVETAINDFWNKSPTSRLRLVKGSVVTVPAIVRTGSICQASTNCEPNPALAVSSDILIACNVNTTNFTSSAILAVTIPNNLSGATIVGSLVLINDQASNQFESKSRAEKASILAHEIGHAVGLGHSPVQDSLMYYATMSSRSALGRDDIDGITYLYPKHQPGGGCATIDLDGGDKPNWWGGLFLGFSIIALSEMFRKRIRVC